ncbi:MAG: GAF domain-containing protein [Myxococcales bacterium]|jgi:hypothetical protein
MNELLGEPADEAVLGRFEIARKGEAPLSPPELPWRRASAGEPVDEREVWIDRQTGWRLFVRVRSLELGGERLLVVSDETAQARAFELSTLAGVAARLLLQAGKPHEASGAIVQKVAEAFEASLVVLLETNGANPLKPTASFGLALDRAEALASPLDAKTPVARAARSRAVVEIEDLCSLEDGAWVRWLTDHGARSLHAVPLSGFGAVAGVLLVARRHRGALEIAERQALMATGEAWAVRLQEGRARLAEQKALSGLRAMSEAAFERGAKVPLRELLRVFRRAGLPAHRRALWRPRRAQEGSHRARGLHRGRHVRGGDGEDRTPAASARGCSAR